MFEVYFLVTSKCPRLNFSLTRWCELQVFANAKCFKDKLVSMHVLVQSLSVHSNSIEKAYKHCVSYHYAVKVLCIFVGQSNLSAS